MLLLSGKKYKSLYTSGLFTNKMTNLLRRSKYSSMTGDAWNRLADRGRDELSAYIKTVLDSRTEEIDDIASRFRGLEHLLSADVGLNGHFMLSQNYSLDADSILTEVRIWSELVADEVLPQMPETQRRLIAAASSDQKTYLSKIISSYVLKKITAVLDSTPENLNHLAYDLFLSLPAILDACTKPRVGGIMGVYFAAVERESEKEFKPSLNYDYGEDVDYLNYTIDRRQQQIAEASRTESTSLLTYLSRKKVDLDAYAKFRDTPIVNKLITSLDGKLTEINLFHTDDAEDQIELAVAEFVAYLADASQRLHSRIFAFQVDEMQTRIESTEPNITSALTLFAQLKEFYAKAPTTFYIREILAGNSPVEQFEHADTIKEQLGDLSTAVYDDPRLNAREREYMQVLIEMKGSSHNDFVYDYLARMLQAQQNGENADYGNIAFRYSIVVRKGGNPNCLDGMERESLGVKEKYLILLGQNSEQKINDPTWFEEALRHGIAAAKTDVQKLEFLDHAKIQLESMRDLYG